MPFILPSQTDVHVNRPLSDILIAFVQSAKGFVADRFAPNIPGDKKSDSFFKYTRADWNRDQAKERAPGTESAGINYRITTDTFTCKSHAIHFDVFDDIRGNADNPIDMDRDATNLVAQQLLIHRELTWATAFFAGGIWTGGDVDGVAAAPGAGQFLQWNDPASDPLFDIRTAKRTAHLASGGFMPNTLVLGRAVFDALLDHPDIVGRFDRGQTTGVAVATVETLQALFEIPRVLVMDGVYNAAAEGATEANTFIGGKKALLAHVAPNPGKLIPSAAYTFTWKQYGAGPAGERTEKFRMPHLKSDRVEGSMSYDQKLIASELGYFFDTAVA